MTARGWSLAATAVVLLVTACGAQPVQTTPTTQPTKPAETAPALPTASPSVPASPADVIFREANVITMDDARPLASAVAVRGDRIVAVGIFDEFAGFIGPDTKVVRLGGLTLTPGFIDAHQHRIGDGPSRLGVEPKQLVDDAISQGFTTIDELYVHEPRIAQLRDLDQAGVLRIRVNAYLPVQENSPEGASLGDYYAAYKPGEQLTSYVRIAGLKVFTDYDNANILLWKQADLDAFLRARHAEGWPLAVKTVATESLEMILKAFESIRAADPKVVEARGRLEHMLFATPDQIARVEALGMVPAVNLNLTGDLLTDPGVTALVDREPEGSLMPFRSVFDAGIPAAGITGFPSGYVDEPSGAPFGSPMRILYEAVTRIGTTGDPPKAVLGAKLTIEQAMQALTVNAARATFQEDELGSIAVGKLADLVVLSADPLTAEPGAIKDIETLVTMIGGRVEWCAPGSESLCPAP